MLHPVTTVDVDGTRRTLDWQLRHDPKSLNYKIENRLGTGRAPRNRIWNKSVFLDQGQEGACVGFSCAHVVATTPKRMVGITDDIGRKVYHGAQTRDEWAGENYEGSSVLGGMTYLKEVGVLSAYYWATTLSEILEGLSYFGPIVMGVDWYNDMFEPDSNGYLHVSGGKAGGHAIEVGGNSLKREAVWVNNSWGMKWGIGGGAWIKWTDLDKLREDQGEFALPRKVKSGTLSLP